MPNCCKTPAIETLSVGFPSFIKFLATIKASSGFISVNIARAAEITA